MFMSRIWQVDLGAFLSTARERGGREEWCWQAERGGRRCFCSLRSAHRQCILRGREVWGCFSSAEGEKGPDCGLAMCAVM